MDFLSGGGKSSHRAAVNIRTSDRNLSLHKTLDQIRYQNKSNMQSPVRSRDGENKQSIQNKYADTASFFQTLTMRSASGSELEHDKGQSLGGGGAAAYKVKGQMSTERRHLKARIKPKKKQTNRSILV